MKDDYTLCPKGRSDEEMLLPNQHNIGVWSRLRSWLLGLQGGKLWYIVDQNIIGDPKIQNNFLCTVNFFLILR